jgi:hypothetical protein
MKHSRKIKTVMLESVSANELVLRTNASKIVSVLLIFSIIILVTTSALLGRVGGGLGSTATFEIGLICFLCWRLLYLYQLEKYLSLTKKMILSYT